MSFSEWKEVLLEDIADLTVGFVGSMADEYVEEGIPFLRSLNIEPFKIKYDGIKYISQTFHDKLQKSKLSPGDVVIVRTGKPGACTVIPNSLVDANCSDLVIIRPHKQKIDSYFLAAYVNSVASGHVDAHLVGAVQQHFNVASAKKIKMLLPALPEQKAIVATLSYLDDKIELNNSINKTLEEMAQAIFKSWFVDFEPLQDGEFEDSELGMIPNGWSVVEFSEICRFVKGKKPKTLLDIKTSESEEQYLTIDVLKGGNPQFACIDKMVISNIYDVLMVMDGASSGTVYFGLKGIVGSTIAKFEVTHEQLREIVYQYLKINEAEIKAHNTGSAIPHTDKGYVSKCKIAVPDDEILKQIAMSLKKIRESIINNSNENQTLILIRDTLLPKLMCGEIRVPIEEVK